MPELETPLDRTARLALDLGRAKIRIRELEDELATLRPLACPAVDDDGTRCGWLRHAGTLHLFASVVPVNDAGVV